MCPSSALVTVFRGDFAMGFLKNGDLTFANSPVKTKKG
jgi:hypothetical protein